MRFLDKAKVYIKAGNGGSGCISFRREKFIEFGGPNGGNGGDGGNVYLSVDNSLNTLIDFRYKQHFKAQNGTHGKGKNLFGNKGKDLILLVPNNTIVWDEKKSLIITELNQNNKSFLIAAGGKGGKGNACFKNSINQAPKFAEKGTTGQELWIWLELQLFADVGLVGLPNSGKSTLLSVISNAKTKIANYPFSTTIPSLGVVTFKNTSFIVADIPGLIEGASKGKGLGFNFLAHINKCKILLHLIDSKEKDFYKAFTIINHEIKNYNKNIINKPQIIVFTQTDTVEKNDLLKKVQIFNQKLKNNKEILLISSKSNVGINKLLNSILTILQNNFSENSNKSNKLWSPI